MSIAKRFAIVIFLTFTTGILAIGLLGHFSTVTYTASKAARYAGTPEQILGYLTQPEERPSKHGEVKKVEVLDLGKDGKKRWRQTTANGARIEYQIVSENAHQSLSINVKSASFGMTANWNYILSSVTDNVTEVNIQETLTVKNEWVRGLMVLTGRDSQLKQEHRHLAEGFEFSN